jgi:glycosyltransferase involved in cell wall biosynthesis
LSLKVLHISPVPYISSGILKQLLEERHAASELGIPWETLIFSPTPNSEALKEKIQIGVPFSKFSTKIVKSKIITAFILRRNLYKWLKSNSKNYDLILIRYVVHDPWLLKFAFKSKIPVGTIHHTIEEKELDENKKILSKFRSKIEHFIGKLVLKRVNLIVAVTPEILRHQVYRSGKSKIFSIVYPNGVLPQKDIKKDERGSTPEFIFMASRFSSWHGLDSLIKEMQQDNSKILIHVVGEVFPADVINAEKDSRFILHGSLSGRSLFEIMSKSWMGISALAPRSKGLQQLCSLKTREYLSHGLPVYGNHEEVFPKSFPFFINGKVDIKNMVFHANIFRKSNRNDVIRQSIPYISKPILLSEMYASLERSNLFKPKI